MGEWNVRILKGNIKYQWKPLLSGKHVWLNNLHGEVWWITWYTRLLGEMGWIVCYSRMRPVPSLAE